MQHARNRLTQTISIVSMFGLWGMFTMELLGAPR